MAEALDSAGSDGDENGGDLTEPADPSVPNGGPGSEAESGPQEIATSGTEGDDATGASSGRPGGKQRGKNQGGGSGKQSGAGAVAAWLGPPPKAVVVDTNLLGKGTFDVSRLRRLASRLARSGIEVWVPLQVVMEWARHAADEAHSIAVTWRSLANAGLIDAPAPSTVSTAVLAQLTALIDEIENVSIVPMTGEAAVAAIIDQILGTGPGTTKQDVKTGAADSSLVRDAIACAGGHPSQIVFCSGNEKDVRAATRAMGFDDSLVHVRRSIFDLYQSLFATVATDASSASQIAARLADHLVSLELAEMVAGDPYHFDTAPWLELSDLSVDLDHGDLPDGFESLGYSVDGMLTLVAVTDLEVVETAQTSTGGGEQNYTAVVGFRLLVSGLIVATGYEVDSDGEPTYSWFPVETGLISVPCTADMSDLVFSNVEATDTADVTSHDVFAADTNDAWAHVIELIADLSGVTFDDDPLSAGKSVTVAGGVGRSVLVEPSGGPSDEEWELTFTLQSSTQVGQTDGDESGRPRPLRTLSVRCEYDPGARVWASSDSFYVRPPYTLVALGAEDVYGVVRAIWRWLLAGVYS